MLALVGCLLLMSLARAVVTVVAGLVAVLSKDRSRRRSAHEVLRTLHDREHGRILPRSRRAQREPSDSGREADDA